MSDILIIEDDTALCALLKKSLELENHVVTIQNNGADGLLALQKKDYQLLVLDVMLPIKNGFEVLTVLRKTSNIPVLMLTARNSQIDKVSGLRMGADDYLTKPFNLDEFIARVQSLLRRYTTLGSEVTADPHVKTSYHFEGLSIFVETREVFVDGKLTTLTAKEFDLLYFLASQAGKVFTKKQIYRAVWEDEYAFDDNNIMVHMRRLRKKIERDPEEPKLIQTVWGVGYKFGGISK